MKALSPKQVLLQVSSPHWKPQAWVDSFSKPQRVKSLELLWHASASLAQKKGRKSEDLFRLEWASLKVAEYLGKKLTWTEKRKVFLSWLTSPRFLKLSEKVLFSDECIDRFLGLFERKVQHELKDASLPASYYEEALYLDLPPEDLYTPYRIIVRWAKTLELKAGACVVDLGSGVGRIPITLGLLYPSVSFSGIEIMKERHTMAEKARVGLRIPNVTFICANLSKRGLPPADIYYLFNPFIGDTLRQVFKQLRQVSQKKPIQVAVAKIEAPWAYIRRQKWLKRIRNFEGDRGWEGIGIGLFESD